MSAQPFRMGSRIKPVECPDPDRRPWVRQLIPQAGVATRVYCVHNHVQGYATHWIDGRTRPCLNSRMFCEGCQRASEPRWEGYIGVVVWPRKTVAILKITKGAWNYSRTLKREQGALRGKMLICCRLGSQNNSPLSIEMAPAEFSVQLPPMWPLQETLARLWGYNVLGDIEDAETVDLSEISQEIERRDAQ